MNQQLHLLIPKYLAPASKANRYRLEEIGIAEKVSEIFYPNSKNDCANTFERY